MFANRQNSFNERKFLSFDRSTAETFALVVIPTATEAAFLFLDWSVGRHGSDDRNLAFADVIWKDSENLKSDPK